MVEEIQQDVLARTGHMPALPCSDQEEASVLSIEQILEQELTVDRAVAVALLNNYHLQATFAGLGIAQAQLIQAGLLNNPILSASYRYSSQPIITNLIDIALIQNFLDVFLIPLKRQMAAFQLEAAKAGVAAQMLDVIAETKIAFYMLQALEQTWSLKKLVLLSAESSYDAAKRLFEAGNIRDLELTANRIFYEQTKQELADLEADVLEARERLNVLMGLWGDRIAWTASTCLPTPFEEKSDWDDSERLAIANSLDLVIARKNIDAAATGFGIDTTRIVFPQIGFGPSSERDEGTWFVGPAIGIGIPIFDWGQAVSAAARAEILRQWNEYAALAVEIRSAARATRIRLLNARRQVQYDQQVSIPLVEQLTSLTLLQHNAMQLGVFDLLSAKTAELEKKIRSVQHLRDYWIARTQLESIVNGYLLKSNGGIPMAPNKGKIAMKRPV